MTRIGATGIVRLLLTVGTLASFSQSAAAQTPTFTVSPGSLKFGNQVVGTTSAPKTATITNTNAAALTFTLALPPEYTALTACGGVVPPNSTCAVTVRFTPTVLGKRNGSLLITDAANPTWNRRTVNLTGTGANLTTLSPTTLAFGNVVQGISSASKTVKLTNNQDVPLTAVVLSSNNPDYAITGCAGGTLQPKASCSATVVFTPTRPATAADNGKIAITHSAATSPESVTLTGTSVFPMSFASSSLTISSTIVGFTRTGTLSLKNNQRVPLTNVTLTPSGPFTATGCSNQVNAGQSCTITVTFAPLAAHVGSVVGSLLVTSTNPTAWNRPTATLRGTGAPQMTVTSNPTAFGSLAVAATSAAKTVTITNNRPSNAAALTFSSPKLQLEGLNPGDFNITATTCGIQLASGGTCTASLTFKPTQDGARSAEIQVLTTNAIDSPHKATLSGTGITPITVTPSKLSFSSADVGTASAGKLVTLKNNQSVPLTLGTIAATGDFVTQDTAATITTCGGTLAAGASCDVSVVFKPTIGGARTGTLVVPNGTTAVVSVPLSGSGAKAVTVSGNSLAFGSQKVNTSSAPKPITLTNHQTVPATLNTLLGGANAGNFTHTDSCGGQIPALSTCVVAVTFRPTASGNRSGNISVDNPGSSRLSVNLSGTGSTTDPPAAIANVSPGAGAPGTDVSNIVITGNGYTHFAANSTVTLGAGVSVVGAPTFISSNALRVNLSIASNATPGGRNVSVTTGTETASLASGFIVIASAPESVAVAPDSGAQGQTLNVAIVGANGSFAAGITTANFGEGIFVNGAVSVVDGDHASANVTISPTATLGDRAVTVVTGGTFATLSPGFRVLASNAALTSLSQNNAAQATGPFTITVNGSNTHFQPGATEVSFGDGISVANVQVINQLQLTASISVQGAAVPGLRSVIATTGGEVARLESEFTVTPSTTTPHLSSVTPTSGQQGQTFTLSIVGVNTDFDGQATSLSLGSNITVGTLTRTDTTISTQISIALIAAIGSRDAVLTSGSTEHHFSFTVLPSSASIQSVTPSVGGQGSQLSITVTGADTHWDQNTTNAWFLLQSGCLLPRVTRIQVNSPTSAVLDLDLPANGCVGVLPFQMATGGETVGASFSVYRQTPTMMLSPSSGMVGTTVTVNFVGEFTHFSNNAPTTAVIDGAKVAIEGFEVLSPTSATARFVIQPDALSGGCFPTSQSGCHTVTVTTPLGSASEVLAATFHVTSTPAVLTSIDPFHAAPGTTTTVRIQGSNTHFTTGLTTVGFGPDIAVNTLAIVNAGELTASITIASAAATGYRSAYVNTGDEQLTIGFRVDGPASPAIAAVTPASGRQGQALTVAITGTNTHFDASSQLILGAGVTVAQFTVTGPTTGTAIVDISPTAPVGPSTVVVMTPLTSDEEVVSGLAFAIDRGTQNIKFVKRPSDSDPTGAPPAVNVTQNQTLNLAIVGEGTHWLQGGTTADFGAGIVLNQLSVIDATHATAQVTVLSAAALGFHGVALSTGGEYATLTQAINVQQATPVLVASSLNAGGQGTTFDVQVLGSQTHWQQGLTTASYGDGITVNSFTIVDSASGVMNVTVQPHALVDSAPCRTLTVTTGAEQVSLPGQFCVTAGPARITSIDPSQTPQSSTLAVTVTGQDTHFVAGVTTADFGPGINVTAVNVVNATTVNVSLAVPSGAANGFRTVTLRTFGEVASQSYAFIVGQNNATLNSASPNTAQQGQQNVTVRLTGQNTHWTPGVTTATFGQGVTVLGVSVLTPTTLDALISVDPLAATGGHSVTVATGGELVTNTIFSVTATGGITDVAPDSGNQGQDIVLNIAGQGTQWAQGLTQFSIAGAGGDIKINYVLINSPTSATAGITISPTAALGGRSVYMTTGAQTLVDVNALIVTGGVPAIASVAPGSALQGQTSVNVQIQGLYTEWLTGATTVDFGPGLAVQQFTINNDTSITAIVDVAAAAAPGIRKVTVRNVRQGAPPQVLEGNFEVVSITPPAPYLAYMSPTSGLRGQTFAIMFAGQYTHWNPTTTTVEILGTGITINSFQVTSPTSAVANVSISPDAAFASHTIEIETGTELVQASFAVVQEVPALTVIDPGAGMQGASVLVNVLGQYTGFNETTTFTLDNSIAVDGVEVLGATIARLQLTISDIAPQGFHTLTATTGAASVSGSFFVTPSQAVIVGVTPNAAKQNDVLTVDITGQNTHWTSGTQFSFGGGVDVTGQNVIDAAHASVTISLESLAGLGARAVTATTSGEVASMNDAFIVQPGTPLVLSSAPGSVQQQQNITLTILGQYTNWVQGQTTVTVDDSVTINTTTVTSATSITAQGVVQWFAAPGARTITVTTGSQVLTLPYAFSVTNGPAAIALVSPNQAGQSATLNVAVTGTNTHFTQGVTAADFGQGVAVNGTQVNSPTSATVNVTVASNALVQQNPVTMTTHGEVATAQNAFTIQQTTGTIQFVTPSSRAQGTTSVVKVIGAVTNFTAATAFNFGPGVTVNSHVVISGVEADVNITVSALATLSTRNVTATTGGVTATGINLFTVTAGPAFLSSITPHTGKQNRTGLQVTITGNGTHFTTAPPVVNLGAGVTVTNVQVTSATLLVATVNISPSAPLQLNDVSVTTSGEVATYPGGFEVTAGDPIVASISPTSARQDDTLDVTVTGLYTHFAQGTTTASFGAGIVVNGPVLVTSPTQATVNITVQPSAATVPRTVTMATNSEIASAASAFTVQPGLPKLLSVTPNTIPQAATETVTIVGLFTNFTASSSVTFGGSGVTAGAVTLVSATEIQVPVTVSAGASVGARTVTVTTGAEAASMADGLTVLSAPPTITIISPNIGAPNSTLNVTITGEYTHFTNGVTVAKFGPGISVGGGPAGGFGPVSVNSQTSATATLDIAAGATLGPRDVTVQSVSEVLNVNAGFTVQTFPAPAATILSIVPYDGATGAPTNSEVTILFSAPLDRTTVNIGNVRLTDGLIAGGCDNSVNNYTTSLPGTVTVDASGRVVTFAPSVTLAVGRRYQVCIDYGQHQTPQSIKDAGGNFLSYWVYTFFTGFGPDNAGPSFTAANIADGDTTVPINAPIMLGFTKRIDPTTVGTGLSITTGGTTVTGAIGYTPDYKQLTFTPSPTLNANTTYTVTYTAAIQDWVGTPLVNPGSFTFTTSAAVDGAPPLLVSYSPTAYATSLNPTVRVVFDEPLNPLRSDSSAFLLRNTHTGWFVPGTTSTLSADRRTITLNANRALDPGTQYDWSLSYAWDRAGFAAGYGNVFRTSTISDATGPVVSTKSPASATTAVPLNARIQIRFSDVVSRAATAVLALTPNVPGTLTLAADNLTYLFTPSGNLAPNTTYNATFSGAADDSGNVMTPLNWSFTTGTAADTTQGTLSMAPASELPNVPTNATVVITFTEPVDVTTLHRDSIRIYDAAANNQEVAGSLSVSADALTVTFTPTSGYAGGHRICAAISQSGYIFDLAGNYIPGTSQCFYVGTAADTTSPQVISVMPVNGATEIGPANPVTVTFSEPLRITTAWNGNVALYRGTTLIAGSPTSIAPDGLSLTFNATLAYGATYTVVVTPNVTDLAGNPLPQQFSSSFTVAARPVTTRPQVIAFRPGAGANNVDPSTTVTFFLTQAVDPATVPGAVFVAQNGVLLPGTVVVNASNRVVTLTPTTALEKDALIEVWFTSDAADSLGNRVFDYQASFRTVQDLTTTPPTLVYIDPANTSDPRKPLNQVITLQFSKPLDPATVSSSNVFLKKCDVTLTPVTLTLHNGNTVLRITPNSLLTPGECEYYRYTLTNGIRDVDGLAYAGNQYYFYIGTSSDTVSPSVTHVAPANFANPVAVNATIRLTLNRAIEFPTISPQTVTLRVSGGPFIPYTAAVTTNGDGSPVLALTPMSALPTNTNIQVAVTNGVQDSAGHSMAVFSAVFTTSNAPDFSLPAVVAATVEDGSTGVPVTSVFTLTFDRPMNTRTFINTVNGINVYLYDNFLQAFVPTTMSFSSDLRQVTLAPNAPLAVNRSYAFGVAYELDLAGNVLPYSNRNFTTALFAPAPGPAVLVTTPQNSDSNVGVNLQPAVRFDRSVMRSSVTNITLTRNGTQLAYTPAFETGDTVVRLMPVSLLQPNSTYVFTVTGVKDYAGATMAGSTAVTFTTGPTIDLVVPMWVAASPYDNQLTGTNPVIRFRINEPIDPMRGAPGIIQNATTQRLVNGVANIYSSDRRTVTLTYPGQLEANTRYTICSPNLFDYVGNYGGTPCYTFTTGYTADGVAPSVVATSPQTGATNVPLNAKIAVSFSEPIDATSVLASSTSLTPSVGGALQLSADGLTLSYLLAANLSPNTGYTVHVSGVADLSGNAIAPASFSFTTAAAADTSNGTVTLTSPAPDAVGVSTGSSVVLTLSKPVNPPLFVADAFQVIARVDGADRRIPGSITISNSGLTLTFTPYNQLPPNALVFVRASYYTFFFDQAGNYFNSLGMQFITGAGPDTTAPAIVSVTPLNGATGVGPNVTVTLLFSEPINPSTITHFNFALYNGYADITQSVSYSSDLRVVTMTGAIAYGSTVTVSAGTGTQDLNGNGLAASFRSTFTVLPPALAAGPAITQMRPAPGSTNVPASSVITLYVSNPLLASSLTGALAVAQDGVLINGSTSLRSGGRSVVFTPSQPFAAGARIHVFLTTAAKDTSGTAFGEFGAVFTVEPSTAGQPVQVTSAFPLNDSNIPTNTVVDVRFNKPIDSSYANSNYFYLTDSSEVTVVPSIVSQLQPNIVRLTPLAPLSGSPYFRYHVAPGLRAADGTTLPSEFQAYFYIAAAADNQLPTVTNIAPVNGATNVGDNATIRFAFNKVMADMTLNPSTITLVNGGNALPYSLTFNTNNNITSVTLTPQAPLPNNAQVTLSLSAGITDRVGHPITAHTVIFTTASGPDRTPPALVRRSPEELEATGVPTNLSSFVFVFDEPLEPAFVNSANYFIYQNAGTVFPPQAVTLSADLRTVTLTVGAALEANTPYSFCGYNVVDLAGNTINVGCYGIVTGAAASTGSPQVIATTPVASGTDVSVNSVIEVTFDRAVSPTSFDQLALKIGAQSVPFAASLSSNVANLNGRVVKLVPSALLNPSTMYTLTVEGVRDLAGQAMSSPYSITFTTAQDHQYANTSLTGVRVLVGGVYTLLTDGQMTPSVSPSTSVQVSFTKPVAVSSILNGGVQLFFNGATVVPVTVTMSIDGRTATLTPQSPLAVATFYQVRVNYNYAVIDQSGYHVSGNGGAFNFTTQ